MWLFLRSGPMRRSYSLAGGKAISLEDETYLHGLEDRLLDRYKRFAYPLLKLNGESLQRESKIGDLEKKLESQGRALDYLQSENIG
jgi:hypothetical protein